MNIWNYETNEVAFKCIFKGLSSDVENLFELLLMNELIFNFIEMNVSTIYFFNNFLINLVFLDDNIKEKKIRQLIMSNNHS